MTAHNERVRFGRGVLKRAAALLVGTLFALLLGEAAAALLFRERLAGIRLRYLVESERGRFCRYDSTLGWAGLPGAQGDFEWADCRFRVTQNEEGFRGPAYGSGRGGAPRVVALGDSFVWGFGVEEDQIFTALLARGTGAEVVNGGTSGYGPDQDLLSWQRHAGAWAPDQVLLFVTLANDLQDIAVPERYGYAKPAFRVAGDGALELTNVPVPAVDWAAASRPLPVKAKRGRLGSLLDRSALFAVATDALARTGWAGPHLEAAGMVTVGGADLDQDIHQRPAPPEVDRAWRVLAAVLRTLRDDVRRRGARLTVVAIPCADQVYDDRWERVHRHRPLPPGATLEREEPERRLAALALELDVALIDLLPDLQRAGRRDRRLYYAVNHHWTVEGHRLVAQVVGARLGLGVKR